MSTLPPRLLAATLNIIRKTFVFQGDNDPMFSVLDHLLALATHDQAFEVEAFTRSPMNIFRCEIPEHKSSLALRWKTELLNTPIFRQPIKRAGAWSTSPVQPLKASTWLRYLKRLGINAGLEHPFTQYAIRRGLLNAVNGKFILPVMSWKVLLTRVTRQEGRQTL